MKSKIVPIIGIAVLILCVIGNAAAGSRAPAPTPTPAPEPLFVRATRAAEALQNMGDPEGTPFSFYVTSDLKLRMDVTVEDAYNMVRVCVQQAEEDNTTHDWQIVMNSMIKPGFVDTIHEFLRSYDANIPVEQRFVDDWDNSIVYASALDGEITYNIINADNGKPDHAPLEAARAIRLASGVDPDQDVAPRIVSGPDNVSDQNTYIVNANTKKFHKASCSEVDKIAAENRQSFTGSREDLLTQGYDPCEKCRP